MSHKISIDLKPKLTRKLIIALTLTYIKTIENCKCNYILSYGY
jgi:hypothetical protein